MAGAANDRLPVGQLLIEVVMASAQPKPDFDQSSPGVRRIFQTM
jgi:hypothetical protein